MKIYAWKKRETSLDSTAITGYRYVIENMHKNSTVMIMIKLAADIREL